MLYHILYNLAFLPLDSLFFQQIAYLMHDVDHHIAPKNIVTLFKKVRSVHSYRTRPVNSDKFYLDYSKLNIQQNAFSRLGAQIWSSIPPTIRNLRKSSFKKNINNLLFKVLIEYDDYVDVHKIIQIVPNCNFSTDKFYQFYAVSFTHFSHVVISITFSLSPL